MTVDVTELSNFLSLRAFERERRRVETLQANVLEKQRLRREVALYRARAAEREQQRLRTIAEERRRQAAAAEAARMRAEAEARAAAERRAEDEERLRMRQLPPRSIGRQQTPVAPSQDARRGGQLPSPSGNPGGQNAGPPAGQGLNFDLLPDITVQ